MSDLYFNEESDYSEKIRMTMKSFAPPFFNHFSLSLKKRNCGNMSHQKETKPIHASAANLLHIRIENLVWCKCGRCKNEARDLERYRLSLLYRDGCNG